MTSLKPGQAQSESGFTLIDMLFVVALIGLLSTLAIPGLMRARGAAQSASALGTVRVVNSAQLSFAITCGFGFYCARSSDAGQKAAGGSRSVPGARPVGGSDVRQERLHLQHGRCGGLPAHPHRATASQLAPAPRVTRFVADPLDVTPPARYFGTNADGSIFEDTASYLLTMPETGLPPGGAPIK